VHVQFNISVVAPPHSTLIGWQECEGSCQQREVLQLLARAHGQFLPVEVRQWDEVNAGGGPQTVQVS
jgi:hypothetical protein